MKGFRKPFLSALALLCLAPLSALADCANPAGVESQIVYNADYKVLQFCNGTDWINMSSGALTCSNAPAVPGDGYFVMTSGTWNGNLGGKSGADAKCLADLTAYDWMGKTDANSRGLLISSKVKAFLCVGSGCEMPHPSTRYFFAVSGDNTNGGAYFDADASGYAPNNAYSWSAPNYFGTGALYWTGNFPVDNTYFANVPDSSNYICADWTSTGVAGRRGDSTGTDSQRWGGGTIPDCTSTFHLVCFVHP